MRIKLQTQEFLTSGLTFWVLCLLASKMVLEACWLPVCLLFPVSLPLLPSLSLFFKFTFSLFPPSFLILDLLHLSLFFFPFSLLPSFSPCLSSSYPLLLPLSFSLPISVPPHCLLFIDSLNVVTQPHPRMHSVWVIVVEMCNWDNRHPAVPWQWLGAGMVNLWP